MSDKRNTDLDSVLFPVEFHPVFLREAVQTDASLFDEAGTDVQHTEIPNFRAIVDLNRHHTFAVVSDSYRLVTNEEAVKLGRQCFQQVFSEATAEGMEVYNIIMPSTRSFCHIDFMHKGHTISPWDGDDWGPYLRVTNSYNRTKPLRFDLGFCRWICTNGMIFGSQSIEFRYYHTRDQIGTDVEFEFKFGELKQLEARFIERLHNLKRYYVPQEHMLALVCKALEIEVKPDDLRDNRKRVRLFEFRDRVNDLVTKYISEMGPNGYAALNVITDFASRPTLYISQESMVDPLQKRSGDWVTKFLKVIEDRDFNYETYLGEFASMATP